MKCKKNEKQKAKDELFAFLKKVGVAPEAALTFDKQCPTLWRLLK